MKTFHVMSGDLSERVEAATHHEGVEVALSVVYARDGNLPYLSQSIEVTDGTNTVYATTRGTLEGLG